MLLKWISDLYNFNSSGVAHFFVLHGNVYDKFRMDESYLDIFQCLGSLYCQNDSLIMLYNRTSGLRFSTKEMEDSFVNEYIKGGQKSHVKNDPVAEMSSGFAETSEKSSVNQWLGEDPYLAMKKMGKILSSVTDSSDSEERKKKVLIVDFAHNLAQASIGRSGGDESMMAELWESWSRQDSFADNNAVVILVIRNQFDLSNNLRASDSKIKSIHIPKPNFQQRQACWIDNVIKKNGVVVEDSLYGAGDVVKLSRITSGLSLNQLDEIYNLAKFQKKVINSEMINVIKEKILTEEFGTRVEIKLPKVGLDYFGGKPKLKEYMRKLESNISNGIYRRVPMGILAAGPPGTGKTFFFECFAHDCGFNFVKISNPRSMYVGESERIMDEIFLALKDLSPVIVIEDEADQSENDRDSPSGDSGTSNRLRQKKLEFCSESENRGKVIWIRITNRPDNIDIALKRKGRTDICIPFLPPEVDEYYSIFKVMFARYDIPMSKELKNEQHGDWQKICQMVKDKKYCFGADIESMVLEADIYSGDDNRNTVSFDDLKKAINDWKLETDPEEIDRQIEVACKCSSNKFLPDKYKKVSTKNDDGDGRHKHSNDVKRGSEYFGRNDD